MKKLLALVMCYSLLTIQVWAQNRTITGKVTDSEGKAIAGASIVPKGSKKGTLTSVDGEFTLTIDNSIKSLIVTSLNFMKQEISIVGKTTVAISLNAEENKLEEVVVVGYSKTTKEAFTGSAKKVSGEQLSNKSVSNISQALAGEVSGVRVINTSGQPGTSATIRIRGFGSVNGNRDPLYVIDGVPYSGTLNSVNPDEVADMVVLKDAAATSIYGSRGANGVIVVTTKNGRGKKAFVTVDAKFGTNRALLPRYDVLTSPEEYIGLSWEALYNQGSSVTPATDPIAYANTRLFSNAGIDPRNNMWTATNGATLIDPATRSVRSGVGRLYDPERWQDYGFQPSSRSEVNIQFGGGDNKTNYFSSFGYLDDIGYSVKTSFKRLNGRLNLNHEVKPWLSTVFNINFSQGKTNNNGQGESSNSIFWFADNIPSIYPLFMRDASGNKIADPIFGGFRYDYGETGRKFGSLTNAIADANFNTVTNTKNELTANTSATLKFTKELTLENRLGVQFYGQNFWTLTNKFYGSAASQNGSINQRKDNMINLNLLSMLRYANRFKKHNIEVLAAHEATDFKYNRAISSGTNLVDNYSLELANAIIKNPTATSYSEENKLESYFAQFNYDYDGIYYLSGTIRRDGSSRFLNNPWGNFGSVGASVILSKTSLLNKVKNIPFLKLKASYGILGDQAGVGLYSGYSRIDFGNLNDNPSFGAPIPGNPDLTWETSKMFQTGVEFRVGKFLDGSIDYYVKNTDNLIFERRVGISNGFALITVNDGQLRNSGIEFELTGHIFKKKNFYLDLSINGEHFKNVITRMPVDPSTSKEKIIDVQGNFGWAAGRSIFDYYIRNFAGVDPADGRTTWTVYYDDRNSNKTFDVGEQVNNLEQFYADNPTKKGSLLTGVTKTYQQATLHYTGHSAIPKIRGAANLRAGFRNFDIAVQMLYSFGGYGYDAAYAGLMANGLIGGNNWSTDIRNRWQKSGDITDVPRLSNNADANVASAATRFLTKNDFMALNNIRIGYTVPADVIKRSNLFQEISFFISGDNLWLNSARRGFNPSTSESGNSNVYRYSPLSTFTVGSKIKF